MLILGCSLYKGHFAGHGDHGDVSLPFYAPPVQRQRWGEDQVLPHVNWVRTSFNLSSPSRWSHKAHVSAPTFSLQGDLFFDLFYVGMAYNLGVMLTSAADYLTYFRGTIYFVACVSFVAVTLSAGHCLIL